MSKLEERLRDAFSADAQTVKAGSIPGPPGPAAPPGSLPRRTAWLRFWHPRLLVPVAAAFAVVAVVVAAAAVPLARGHARSAVGDTAAGSAGLPQYFVTNEPGGAADPYSLVVRSTRTGKIVGQLKPLHGVPYGGAAGSGSVAAIGGDRAYVTAVPVGGPCVNELEEFGLNGRGQPGPLMPLHVMVRGDLDGLDSLAITPDGRTTAYATYVCDSGGRYELSVVDLDTGHVKTWTSNGISKSIQGLGLSPDGREVLFTQGPAGPERILRTSAPTGSLAARSQVISSTASWAALARNGAVLYGCTVSPPPSVGRKSGTITFFSQPLPHTAQRVIARYRDVPYPTCMASLDPRGRYLLVDLPANLPGYTAWIRMVVLDLRSGRTTVIPAPALPGPGGAAW